MTLNGGFRGTHATAERYVIELIIMSYASDVVYLRDSSMMSFDIIRTDRVALDKCWTRDALDFEKASKRN